MHARHARRPPAALLYGALLLHALFSAGTYLAAKRALLELPALPLGLMRFLGASACLALLIRFLLPAGKRLPPRADWRRIAVLGFVAVPLNQGFFLVGLQLSTAAHASLFYTLTPLFVLLLAQALLGEFPGPRAAAGTLLALGGTVWVLLLRTGLAASQTLLTGDLLILIAVVAWAVYTTEGRALVQRHGALQTIAWTLICGTLLYAPIGLGSLLVRPWREQLFHASGAAWLGLAYIIAITSVVAYLLWSWALGHIAAARVAVFSNLQPLMTAALAHIFLGEHVALAFWAGAAVVIGGVLLAQTGGAPPPDLPEEALLESPGKS